MNHYASKNEARVVDVSLLCKCMRLSLGEFYLPFKEFALSDESLLLCENGQLHYHIQSKKYTPRLFLGDIISSTVEIKFGPFLRRNLTSMTS